MTLSVRNNSDVVICTSKGDCLYCGKYSSNIPGSASWSGSSSEFNRLLLSSYIPPIQTISSKFVDTQTNTETKIGKTKTSLAEVIRHFTMSSSLVIKNSVWKCFFGCKEPTKSGFPAVRYSLRQSSDKSLVTKSDHICVIDPRSAIDGEQTDTTRTIPDCRYKLALGFDSDNKNNERQQLDRFVVNSTFSVSCLYDLIVVIGHVLTVVVVVWNLSEDESWTERQTKILEQNGLTQNGLTWFCLISDIFMKFLCWAHVRGHVLWTCMSILEKLLLLFYIFFIFVFWVFK